MVAHPDIVERVGNLPDQPGIYIFRDDEGGPLYVGKANLLRKRAASYLKSDLEPRLRSMVAEARQLDFLVAESEAEALLLENNWIKKRQPRYNIRLRDDKTYPSLKLTMTDAYPRIVFTRRIRDDGAEYFGPFLPGGLARKAIKLVQKLFQVRICDLEIDGSLARLGTDHVDLYQIHRWDYDTPIEETMEALHDVVKAGKARYIGASSMYAWQFAKAQQVAERNGWTPFSTMQPMYNLVYREEEREMLPLCADQGVGVIPWSPLARGVLAGKTTQGEGGESTRAQTDENTRKWQLGGEIDTPVIAALREVAEARDVSMAQIALAWVASNPAITAPIVGASKSHHLEQAIQAIDIELSADEKEALEAPYVPHPIAGHN